MPPDDEDRASLVDMLGFAQEVVEFSRGRKRADLDRDKALLRSLERALELVGECARPEAAAGTAMFAAVRFLPASHALLDLQVQQEMGYVSYRLASGPRWSNYTSMARPRTPRVARRERKGGADTGGRSRHAVRVRTGPSPTDPAQRRNGQLPVTGSHGRVTRQEETTS